MALSQNNYSGNEQTKERKSTNSLSSREKVVDLLNKAAIETTESSKLGYLRDVQELIVYKDRKLLDSFLDEVIAYQQDNSPNVRKYVVGFIEEACKADKQLIANTVMNLRLLFDDTGNVGVLKRVILALIPIYKLALEWMRSFKEFAPDVASAWRVLEDMRVQVVKMADCENDGLRTHAIKFVESLVIVLSPRTNDSTIPESRKADISLDQIPKTHKLLNYNELKATGEEAMHELLTLVTRQHITSINLMACLAGLTTIAKQRPAFIAVVVQAFESLYVNLPPTLAKSQVMSVRKHLKLQLSQLLQHPASIYLQPRITTLLVDLGASQTEMSKLISKLPECFKNARAEPETRSIAKRGRHFDDDTDDEGPVKRSKSMSAMAIEVTAESLKMHIANVTNLVVISMVGLRMSLPDKIQPHFHTAYTPIAAAGTDRQIRHLARLMATQMTAIGIGPGIEAMAKQGAEAMEKKKQQQLEEQSLKQTSISTVLGGHVVSRSDSPKTKAQAMMVDDPKTLPQPAGKRAGRIKKFAVSDATLPLSQPTMHRFANEAVRRILRCATAACNAGVSGQRLQILSRLATTYGDYISEAIGEYVLEDLNQHQDLAIAWLYQEYCIFEGYTSTEGRDDLEPYDEYLTNLLMACKERHDPNKSGLFAKLLLEAPIITDRAIDVLRRYCNDAQRFTAGLNTLRQLVTKRTNKRTELLTLLLKMTMVGRTEIRTEALRMSHGLYSRPEFQIPMQKFATSNLQLLMDPVPSKEVFDDTGETPSETPCWTEELGKRCMYLYLVLLPLDHTMVHELATVFVNAVPDIKRTILRVLDTPVKGVGLHSPELLTLVERCPVGAETFITRMMHILTDKTQPPKSLVNKVRDLYKKRVSDVRFIIPVLAGLTKPEIITALPKLIRQNPAVVKEAFNRLLGIGFAGRTPVSPTDLLVSLHQLDCGVVDIKSVIKATSLCFAERSIYTQEVLATTLNLLVDVGFVMSVLQRLISKSVWTQPKLWEGFIKCCERTQPQCHEVLLKLPSTQLIQVLQEYPVLHQPLVYHYHNLPPLKRQVLSKDVTKVFQMSPEELLKEKERLRAELMLKEINGAT